ncbi:NADP-dependent oxidoreductase [Microbispora sp. H10836]|uniref:NADP-dependent oxidoreductase n=1 Tax=Microbispora sp. H10836 TaxID=2729106 RepID=UPI00147367F9|nr:NADP-dependent oxidoreductase [Microbispora sp. H10836]
MSRTVVFSAYGGPEVLRVVDLAPDEPSAGTIRVRVRAAGVQPFDALFRGGGAHAYVPATFPQRLGNEFAGVVDAVGEGVTGAAAGDEVVGWAMLASYAEHVVVPPDQVVRKPASMPWPEAGVLSASGQTADTALEKLRVGAGDTVLVHAAAGGVGTFAVQIARALGATVVGTASERNHAYLRDLGAIPVAYGEGLAERVRAAAPDGVDAALDAAGTVEALEVSAALVTDRTRVGTIAYQPAADRIGVQRLGTERSAARLGRLTALYEKGDLKVRIQEAIPVEEAARAHTLIESGHTAGKLVLVF